MLKALIRRLLALLPEEPRLRVLGVLTAGWNTAKTLRNLVYDGIRFLRYSGVTGHGRRGVLEASIIKTWHRIEKALALKAPRPGFGREAVGILLHETRLYLRLYGPSCHTRTAINTLREYLAFNARHGLPMPDRAATVEELERAQGDQSAHDAGGSVEVRREDFWRDGRHDLEAFFRSRRSVRNFAPDPVPMALVEKAVALAQTAPSVCNRQSGFVFATQDRAKIARFLALQDGNRGFGEQVDTLLIVTARLDTFLVSGERYQAWIDGGLFAMTLIWALHSLGLGSCCLNWSADAGRDKAFRAASGLPDDHTVIMMLAVGALPETFRVAQSPRRAPTEVLRVL